MTTSRYVPVKMWTPLKVGITGPSSQVYTAEDAFVGSLCTDLSEGAHSLPGIHKAQILLSKHAQYCSSPRTFESTWLVLKKGAIFHCKHSHVATLWSKLHGIYASVFLSCCSKSFSMVDLLVLLDFVSESHPCCQSHPITQLKEREPGLSCGKTTLLLGGDLSLFSAEWLQLPGLSKAPQKAYTPSKEESFSRM